VYHLKGHDHMSTEDHAKLATSNTITHHFIETNGIRMHIVEQGQGPLVLLCHGFPETWYSWRYQLSVLAAAGYRVVAPDQRGYGQTSCPEDIASYTILHLVGDLVGLLDALNEDQAVIVGHDWGANVAWHATLLRPDRFRSVITMSVPYIPRGPVYGPRATVRPTEAIRKLAGHHYMLYFQRPGVAEAELERDVRKTMCQLLYALSGDAPPSTRWQPVLPGSDADLLTGMPFPESLPHWLTEEDIEMYTSQFQRSGFRGGLNWYRNIDRNWELLAAYSGAPITQPTLFLRGDSDPSLAHSSSQLERQPRFVPHLREQIFPGCGHWIQQERAAQVNEAIITFLQNL
jgi:pimeloyl-ACP methyl ester carboxylesterase